MRSAPPLPFAADGCSRQGYGIPHGRLGGSFAATVTNGVCRGTVDTAELRVDFLLPSGPALADLRQRLAVRASVRPLVRLSQDGPHVQVTVEVPTGPPETVLVRLAGPFGPGGSAVDLGFEVKRAPAPEVVAEALRDGRWQLLAQVASLPATATDLRFHLRHGADAEQALARIRSSLDGVPAEVERVGDETVAVRIRQPRARMIFSFLDLNGWPGGKAYVAYFGSPPQLVALDPGTGHEAPVAEVPPNVYWAQPSPNGAWAMAATASYSQPWRGDVWLLDLVQGRRIATPFQLIAGAWPVAWWRDRAALAQWGRVQMWNPVIGAGTIYPSAGERWGPASPDGRYLPGLQIHYAREDPSTFLAPATLVIFDVATGTERVFPDATHARVKHSDAPPDSIDFRWLPEGTSLLIPDYRAMSQGGSPTGIQTVWRQVDVGSDFIYPSVGPLPIATDDGRWVPGPGGAQYHRAGSHWGSIVVRLADGRELERGRGFVVGWRPDGRLLVIRWAQSDLRFEVAGGI